MKTQEILILVEGLCYAKNINTGAEHVIFEGEYIQHLKTILARALNCWPEAPRELFQLDQLLRYGEILQPSPGEELFPKG